MSGQNSEMAKIRIFHGEWYPVLSTHDFEGYDDGEDVEVPSETADRWRRATDDFLGVQAEMRAAYEQAIADG